ncbi:MAG: hypothetical protein KKG60_00465 [Nanoarchaeota archaeon]|nr:hypothetical protein [Nanoarchaeota archaeon]
MYLKKKRKAQAAMEYLMTYGWAILIVLIALGALFYLGVFKPRTSNACIAAAPLMCTDVKLDSAGTFTVVAGAVGSSATMSTITLTSPASITMTPNTALGSNPAAITTTFTHANIKKDAKFAGTAKITYIMEGSTITHDSTIQFSGVVE